MTLFFGGPSHGKPLTVHDPSSLHPYHFQGLWVENKERGFYEQWHMYVSDDLDTFKFCVKVQEDPSVIAKFGRMVGEREMKK